MPDAPDRVGATKDVRDKCRSASRGFESRLDAMRRATWETYPSRGGSRALNRADSTRKRPQPPAKMASFRSGTTGGCAARRCPAGLLQTATRLRCSAPRKCTRMGSLPVRRFPKPGTHGDGHPAQAAGPTLTVQKPAQRPGHDLRHPPRAPFASIVGLCPLVPGAVIRCFPCLLAGVSP